MESQSREQVVQIESGRVRLEGDLVLPAKTSGVVLFAHGSGSSRKSSRNRAVAQILQEAGLATLLLDLLSPEEEVLDRTSGHLRFDIPLLAGRLVAAIDWLEGYEATARLPLGLFGASTGGGAALLAAVARPERVRAVVSRGGRPDLAGPALPEVRAPVLLLVGGRDTPVIEMNREAAARMERAQVELSIVPGATHLFEEAGTLEVVAAAAREWFLRYLGSEK